MHCFDLASFMVWTLQDANDALPQVRQMLATARSIVADYRQWQQHLDDLVIVHGAAVLEEGHVAHVEWQDYAARRRATQQVMRQALEDFRRAGIELKDLDVGLVDFPARLGKKVVFLCWKEGEERITSWHPVDAGFAGRKPVPEEIQPDV